MSWEHVEPGLYMREEPVMNGKHVVRAVVMQDGEFWISRVYFDGEQIDLGEWDGRGVALTNARGAMKRAVMVRTTGHLERRDEEEEEE